MPGSPVSPTRVRSTRSSSSSTENGLTVTRRERHDRALRDLIERADARLRLARALGSTVPALAGSIERGLTIAAAARDALASGPLGYGIVVARRP